MAQAATLEVTEKPGDAPKAGTFSPRSLTLGRVIVGGKLVLAAGALIAGLVKVQPLVEVGHKAYIEPLQVPPNLSIETSIEEIGRRNSWISLKVRTSVSNRSSRNVKIVHSWFNMYGFRFPESGLPPLDVDSYVASLHERMKGDPAVEDTFVSRYSHDKHAATPVYVLHSGKYMDRKPWFQAGEEFSTQLVFHVRDEEYDAIRFRIDLTVAADDTYLCEDWHAGGRGEVWADAYDRVAGVFPGEWLRLHYRLRSCEEQRAERARMRGVGGDAWHHYWRETSDQTFDRFKLSHTHATTEVALWPSPVK